MENDLKIAVSTCNYENPEAHTGIGLNITAGHALGGNTAINTTYINLNIWDDTAGTTIVTDGEWTADGGIIMTASYMVS